MVANNESIELGGNIILTGFRDIDNGMMIIVKKIIGNYVKDLVSKNSKFSRLHLTLKSVHERENSEMFEIKAHLTTDKDYNSEITDRNLLFGIDKVLKKIENQIY